MAHIRALTCVWCISLASVALADVSRPADAPEVSPSLQTIRFGSCLAPERRHAIFDAIIEDDPDLFIFAGDNVYADTTNREVLERHYRTLMESDRIQALIESTATVATWDDHDYGANDAGGEYPIKEDSEEVFEGVFGISKSSPAGMRDGVYQSYLFGEDELHLIVLDTRFFRSPLTRGRAAGTIGPYRPVEAADATILGDEQWSWLEQELSRPAKLRLIVSSIQVLPVDHGWESWSNFPAERERLLELLAAQGAAVILLSGDRHFAEISQATLSNGIPIYEITSSGLNLRFPAPAPNENPLRVGRYYLDYNYGGVDIDWSDRDPEIALRVFDRRGRTVIDRLVRLSDLSP